MERVNKQGYQGLHFYVEAGDDRQLPVGFKQKVRYVLSRDSLRG